jgi:hypothetical protein
VKQARRCLLPESGASDARWRQNGDCVKLHGFREGDERSLNEQFRVFFPGTPVSSGEASVCGRNWGEAVVEGNRLGFASGVEAKPAFSVDCGDLANVSVAGKTDVLLEFAVDDTAEEKDSL